MKKIAAVFMGLVLSASAYALPIGNPWEASIMSDGVFWEGHCADYCDPCVNWCDAWSVRIGFYGDYVYNHHMELDRHGNRASIHETQIWTNAAYLALNLYDRFDVFGTLGTSHFEINTPKKSFGAVNNDYATVETETDFSWSIGLRGTIWECGNFGVGGEAQYFRSCPDINYVKEENNEPRYRRDDPFKYHEWQIGFGAAYRINIASCATALIPYMGVKWGRAWVDMNDIVVVVTNGEALTFFNLRSERNFGYAFGLTLLGCNKTSVTVEARFIDEKALYVNGQFRF